MCAMNSWLLYDKQGRCAYIPYGADYTVWGVLPQAGAQPANENTVLYLRDVGGGNIAFMCERQVWASARDDYGGRVQFQAPNGTWIYSPQGDEMFRAAPTGDGYFVLFSDRMGQYIYISGTLDTISNTYPMVAGTDFASATRFYAAPLNRPVVLDFLELYNNASGFSFAGISLANMNLSQANLSLCDLTGVTSLSGCVLNGANLQQAKLAGLHLAGASLSATDFTNTHLDNCVFANLGPATNTTVIQSVTPYAQGDGGSGIGDCKMTDSSTRGFAFDFDSSGKPDHLVFLDSSQNVSSQKALYIIKSNGDNTFTTRYSANSIGDVDLTAQNHQNSQGFAFDLDGSGKLDHLVFYCPGAGIVYIFKSNGDGTFTQRYPTQANPVGTGIGGYDLLNWMDQGFAFDYEGTGKLNYLVFFRATRGVIFIIKSNGDGTFTPLYQVGDSDPSHPAAGIGGCQFLDLYTRGFAFDLTGSGKLDHLVFYYPSQNSVYVIQNQAGTFTAVYPAPTPGGSPALPGFALTEQHIRGFAYDFEGSGKQDYLVFYAPGQKVAVFCKANQQSDGTFTFSQSYYSSQGIGGYDLAYAGDLAFPFDYEGTGKLDYITLFRPGHGAVFITSQRILSGLYPILEQAQLPGATLSTPLPGVNLAGANLAGATIDCDLSGADLSGGVVLTGATITANCDLTGANLSGAHLAGLDLTKVKSMRNANLSGADLTGAKLEGVDLTGAILVGTKLCNILDLTQTTFSQPIDRSTDPNNRTSFAGSTLPYSVIGKDWSYLDLTGTTLAGMPTDLTDLNAVSVMWPSASFINCILDGANFASAILDQANFNQSSLQESAQKKYVIFNDASMIGAKFIQAVLQNVSFRGTVLGGEKDNLAANFSYAFIANCDFTGANLYSAIFAEATLISKNTFNTAANLLLTDFSNAYLPGADFSGATLQGATFDGAFMVQVNLSDADLSPAEEGAKSTSLSATCLQAATFSDTTNLSGANLPNAFFSVTGQAGQITCQYYDLDGSLTAPFPYNYPAGQLPDSTCLSDNTVCPNLQTKKDNENSNVSFQKMMTSIYPPPTQWKPAGTSNLTRFR